MQRSGTEDDIAEGVLRFLIVQKKSRIEDDITEDILKFLILQKIGYRLGIYIYCIVQHCLRRKTFYFKWMVFLQSV